MKKWVVALILLAAVLVSSASSADVEITETNFPDPGFYGIVTGFDTDSNGILQDSEIAAADYLSCEGLGITDLKGIEYFTETTFLVCSNNQLSSLDLSRNKKLRVVYCENNRLSSLNVSGNTRLESLDCQHNQLKQLNVTNNPKLEGLTCHHNQMTRLDISHCPVLIQLTVYGGYTNFGSYSEWVGDDYILSVDNCVNLITETTDTSDDRCTVGGLKYKLSGSRAVVTGPKDKNATELSVPVTIKVDSKTYKVTEIGAGAFKGMKQLAVVTIGKNVRLIGKDAFNGCVRLKTITIRTKNLTASSVKSNAFKGIHKKATFMCPKGLKDTYKKILLKRGAAKTCRFKSMK